MLQNKNPSGQVTHKQEAQKQGHFPEKVRAIVGNDAFLSSSEVSSAFALLSQFFKQDSNSLPTASNSSSFLLSDFGLKDVSRTTSCFASGPASLRSNIIHRQIVEVHRKYLDHLAEVSNELSSIGTDVDALLSDAEVALKELDRCRVTNQQVLEKAQALQLARTHVQMKYRIASKLTEQLKVHDSTIRSFINATKQLSTTTEFDIDLAFELLRVDLFKGIEDIERVRRNVTALICLVDNVTISAKETASAIDNSSIAKDEKPTRTLLQNVEDAEATTGLSKVAANDIMQETKELLEVAYEKLFFVCTYIIRYGIHRPTTCS